jgi:hypothetical protein
VNRRDFQALTTTRLAEAQVLLDAGMYDGAYYLAGYAVECALKACIARQTRTHDFPPKPSDVRAIYTHSPFDLVRAAGLRDSLAVRIKACPVFLDHWSRVEKWSEESRYERWTLADATRLIEAISDPQHGVPRWLRELW